MNPCGNCNLCCKLPAVPEFAKPVNKWCIRCKPGTIHGCTTYQDRPESCQKFECLWLKEKMEPDLRPDRLRVIFEPLPSGKTVLALVNPGYEDKCRTPRLRDAVRHLQRTGRAVVIVMKPPAMILPQGRTSREVMEELRDVAKLYGLPVR